MVFLGTNRTCTIIHLREYVVKILYIRLFWLVSCCMCKRIILTCHKILKCLNNCLKIKNIFRKVYTSLNRIKMLTDVRLNAVPILKC